MIIVEGPDGGGKTTLAKYLSERWQAPIAPRVVSKDAEAMTDLSVWVNDNLEKGWQHTIFDRHRLISEPIYGPVLRSPQADGFTDLVNMYMWFERFYEIRPLLIYCMPRLEVVKANVENDPDNRRVAGSIEALYAGYATRAALDWAHHGMNVVIWDYTTDGAEEIGMDWFHHWDDYVETRKKHG